MIQNSEKGNEVIMAKEVDIEKRENEIIRISIREYKGHDYVDVRQYFKGTEDDFLPTKKGVTFSPELIDDVIEALQSLKE